MVYKKCKDMVYKQSKDIVYTGRGEAFMPRKALYNGLGRHSLCWQANPAKRAGWLVGKECLPRGPIVKGTVE